MEKCIVTIGREYGSGGHKVGEILAGMLHIPYYDGELVNLAAQRGGLRKETFVMHDERKHNPFLYEANYEGNEHVERGFSLAETLFQIQKQVILDIGKTENAIIVGRCADFILKQAKIKTLSVFISAPFEKRVRRTMELEGLDEKTVISLTRKKDRQRKAYYEAHTGSKWGDCNTYDLYFQVNEFCDLNEIAKKIADSYYNLTISQ